MKNLTLTLLVALFSHFLLAQKTILSGEYSSELKLAYDGKAKMVTGYFESYIGWDERTNNPRFSCIFYLEGKITESKNKINTYYPGEKTEDLIEGVLEISEDTTVSLKLPNEHGGCWNVQHFADEPVKFIFENGFNWLQIRYVTATKTYFYSEKSNDRKLKSYLIKGNIVCIEKIEEEWAYCSYFGKKVTKGWLKITDLNIL